MRLGKKQAREIQEAEPESVKADVKAAYKKPTIVSFDAGFTNKIFAINEGIDDVAGTFTVGPS